MNLQTKITLFCAIALSNACLLKGQETAPADSAKTKQSGESERNVMLNASNANEPRQISIGLPGGDTYVMENGLPALYYTNPQPLSAHWRSDGSIGKVGLISVSEAAITTGHIGYGIRSFTELGTDEFKGKANYSTNHFGLQQFDANVTNTAGNNWFYAASVYQSFDPGSFDLKFTNFADRTQFYKAALTKKFGKGQVSLLYKYTHSHKLSTTTGKAPFIYAGEGNVKEYPGFKSGTDSYVTPNGIMYYQDIRTGEMKETNLYDASLSKGNEISLLSDFDLSSSKKLQINAKYLRSQGSLVYQTPMGLNLNGNGDDKYNYSDNYLLSGNEYGGVVQTRMSCLNRGDINNAMLTAELTGKAGKNDWRIGVNEWYYHVDYASNTTMYRHTVSPYPERLSPVGDGNAYYDFNKNASEYYIGYENKLALYATHNWTASNRFNLYYGLRLENYTVDGTNLPYSRYPGFSIGSLTPDNETVRAKDFGFSRLNVVGTASATYSLSNSFGLNGEFTYNTQHPRLENFSSSDTPDPDKNKITVPMARLGVFYNTDKIRLTSMLTWIQKTNNYTRLNLINPEDAGEVAPTSFYYDIETYAWTTDVVTKPFKNFDLHFLFTVQQPEYKKFETEVTFNDGNTVDINATGNIVPEIPQILMEIDPSCQITKDMRAWLSFRYFSKTYANLNNSLYFNGRWETFGGLNYTLNKHLALSATVINFLNQGGVQGDIANAELATKEDVANRPDLFKDVLMIGNYIRPFTVEFSVNIKF